MTDELVKRLQLWGKVFPEDMDKEEGHLYQEAADRIYALTADRENRLADLRIIKAERDAAYARGYSDAEIEISKSALGQKVDFLSAEYANVVHRITDLNELLDEAQTEWSKYASSWMTAEGKLADAEALIEAQAKDHASNNIRFAEAEHRAKTAEAERDRYRKALEDIIADCEADYPPSHGAIKYAAKLALKGETP